MRWSFFSRSPPQPRLTAAGEPVHVRLDPDDWILCQRVIGIMNPTLDEGILLVNGIDWEQYGSEALAAYEARAFFGDHEIAFWDFFPAPAGGYPPTLPAPLGHGPGASSVMGRYSSVVWVGNRSSGDLEHWLESPNIRYLEAGGNILLMPRNGYSFFTEELSEYLGIEWTTHYVLHGATATLPGLRDMTPIGSQDQCSSFDEDRLGPETTLLFDDPSYTPPAGIGAWRTATAGGEFVFLSGRPYRWDHEALHDNTDFILRALFGEGEPTTVPDSSPAGAIYALRLGPCVPNPMTASTRVGFELPHQGPVSIRIYDVAGRWVRTLLDDGRKAGPQAVTWDGRNDHGQPVGSGVYYIRLEASNGQDRRPVIVVR